MKATADPYLLNPEQTVSIHGVTFPLELLFRGLLVVGQPGSGKTRLILLPLLKSILKATGTSASQKAALVISDPKGEFSVLLHDLLKDVGREEDLLILKPGENFYNPISNPFLSANELTEKMIGFANHTHRDASQRSRGDEAFWGNALRSLLTAIVSATRTIHDGEITFASINETFRTVNKFSNATEAMEWMRKKGLSEVTKNAIRDFLNLPETSTRPCVATSLANTIQFWSQDPLKQLTTPIAGKAGINPLDVINQGKVLLITCSSAAYGTSISPLLVALKENFFSAMLSRNEIEVNKDGKTWEPINQTRPVVFVNDEFQSYLTPDASMGEVAALDRMRSFRGLFIGATQNLSSLQSVLGSSVHAGRLIALMANQIYLSNIDPLTASQAEQMLGQKRIKQKQTQVNRAMSPPLIFRETQVNRKRKQHNVIETSQVVPRVDGNVLAAMRTGEFWIRTADGRVVHGQAAPSTVQA